MFRSRWFTEKLILFTICFYCHYTLNWTHLIKLELKTKFLPSRWVRFWGTISGYLRSYHTWLDVVGVFRSTDTCNKALQILSKDFSFVALYLKSPYILKNKSFGYAVTMDILFHSHLFFDIFLTIFIGSANNIYRRLIWIAWCSRSGCSICCFASLSFFLFLLCYLCIG